MVKAYLRATVRESDGGGAGLDIECFRLDAIAEEEILTDEERSALDETAAEGDTTSTAIMRIYEDIGEDPFFGGGISAKRFADDLDALGEIKKLHIHINSLGGDVFAAQAIHNLIVNHAAKSKRAYIDGVCASAATVVACGAHEVIARANTNYMVHLPWSIAIGNEHTMTKARDDLRAMTSPIVNVYKEQCGEKCDEKKIRQLMEDETWMTAEEALEYGFVDRVRGKVKKISRVSGSHGSQIFCSGRVINVAKYHFKNMPDFPEMKLRKKAKAEEQAPQAEPTTKKEKKTMTKEEIEPALLAQIENDARSKERARLAALDALNPRNNKALVPIIAKAKDEGKEPRDIALECLSAEQEANASVSAFSALGRDAAAASRVPAGDAPASVKPVNQQEAAKKRFVNQIDAAAKALYPKGANGAAAGS